MEGKILEILLGASATVLFGLSTIFLNTFINKFKELEERNEEAKSELLRKNDDMKSLLGTLVTDVAVIKKQLDNSEFRITSLEHDFKKIQGDFINLRNKMQGCYRAKGRYDEEVG